MTALKYTPEALKEKVIEYFQYVKEINRERKENGEKLKPLSITAMCNYLDITRETWSEYSKKPTYADSVKKAKQKVEEFIEEGLLNGSLNPIGAIFNLKNNFGWVDKMEVCNTTAEQPLSHEDVRQQLKHLRDSKKDNVIELLPESVKIIE